MPEYIFFVSPPVVSGRRNFYPLIRVFHLSGQSVIWLSVTAIAVIIEEDGEWSFIALEEGVREEIILNAAPIHNINNA